MDLARGAIVGARYTVDAVIGRGGFATVYGVTHRALGTAHALKVLHAAPDDAAYARLLAEGRLQARLAHPNLVRVTDVVELDGGVGLVMDRVRGETLRERLDRGPVPRAEAVAIGAGILAGLAAAHEAGLVHGDVKPANVLLDADGTPRIADFGLAARAGEASGGAGTLGYLPPERVEGGAPEDPRADVFSVGCVLYELLAGERPFPADARQPERARRGELVPIEARVPDLPAHLAVAVAVALSPEPEGRPRNAAELAALWGGDDGPRAEPPPAREPPPVREPLPVREPTLDRAPPEPAPAAPPKRGRWAAALVAGAVTVGLAGAALLAPRPEPAPPPAWNPEVSAAFAAHLASTGLPHAENVARLTSAALDAWYARAALEQAAWESARDADPEALRPRQHLACLDGARLAADATVASLLARDPLTSVDGSPGNPVLPDLDLCGEPSGERAWALPDDPELRAKILELSARPVACLEISWLAGGGAAASCYAAVLADADRLGYAPARVRARADWLAREVELGPLSAAARAELYAAVEEADEQGLDVELTRLLLVSAKAEELAGDSAAASAAAARARVLVKRLGWPHSLHVWLLSIEREQAQASGRWQEATAFATTARDLQCAREGDGTADCAWAYLLLSETLYDEGRFEDALATDKESVRRYRQGLGETHPEQIHARFYLGLRLLRLGRVTEAAEWLGPIPALRARHPGERVAASHLLLAVAAVGRGDRDAVDRELAAADALGLPYGRWEPLRAALREAREELVADPPGDAWAVVAPTVSRAEQSMYACEAARPCPAFQRCDEGRCVPLPAERPVP